MLCDLDCGVGLVDVIDLSLKCNDGTYDTSPLKCFFLQLKLVKGLQTGFSCFHSLVV